MSDEKNLKCNRRSESLTNQILATGWESLILGQIVEELQDITAP